mgnify:FL=1|jgi:hypothetical protein
MSNITKTYIPVKKNNDECYTQDVSVYPILKFIPENAIVWCPFDKHDSNFVKLISKKNEVIYSHIDTDQDFLSWEPDEHWDVIISNPPFTNKKKFFERALSFDKPFALIMSNTWLNDSAPHRLFYEKDLQLLMFDRRMKFNMPDESHLIGKRKDLISFSSSYFCWNFLPKQIIMDTIPKRLN